MKFLKNLTLGAAVAALIIFTNCGPGKGGDDTVIDRFQEQADKFVASWVLKDGGAFGAEGTDVGYNGLTLEVTGNRDGGTFSTNIGSVANGSTVVWPSQSNWNFSSDQGDLENPAAGWVLRDADGIVMSVVVAEVTGSLTISFEIPAGSARTNGIEGIWTFSFDLVQ